MRAFLLFLLLLTGLTYVYLYPGSQAMLERRTDVFMSDGTDPTTLPGAYDIIIQAFKRAPLNFFYGAVYTDLGDPERGVTFWTPWSERWLVVFWSNFFPVEQISTAYIFTLFLLNGISMFLLCSYLGWSRSLSIGLGLAWAFNAFTRARAKVHGAMVGTYHLPLIFLGCYLVVRGKSWRSLLAAAVAFFIAGTTAHYFLVTWVFLSPFAVIFICIQLPSWSDWKRVLVRLVAAVLPLIMMLGFNFLMPLPPDAKMSTQDSLAIFTKPGEIDSFLFRFYARPIDYLTSDISLDYTGEDINPIRELVNKHVLENLDMSNPHERTNGIRWSILLLAILGGAVLFKKAPSSYDKRSVAFFFAFAAFTFWLSLSPDATFFGYGPSYWLYSLFPKVRVASRAGINVHFALLMITGLFLTTATAMPKLRKLLLLPGIFAAVMVIDYFPSQKMPLAPIAPAFAELTREKGPCGTGMPFPYINPLSSGDLEYTFAQRMRGSDCLSLSRTLDIERVKKLHFAFTPDDRFMNSLMSSSAPADKLVHFAQCVPLNWIVFHPATPRTWAADVCRRLGWSLSQDMTCIGADRNKPFVNSPEKCL